MAPKRRQRRYRSARAVRPPTHVVTQWTRVKILALLVGAIILALMTIVPMYLFLPGNNKVAVGNSRMGIARVLDQSKSIRKNWRQFVEKEESLIKEEFEQVFHYNNGLNNNYEKGVPRETPKPNDERMNSQTTPVEKESRQSKLKKSSSILEGAQKGRVNSCSEDVSDMIYWNDPQGTRDVEFISPFVDSNDGTPKKFFSFEPDPGGWNNIRMALETILILASATGRTLILPPKTPLYLLGMGASGARSFGSFMPLFSEFSRENKSAIPIITMSQFVEEYGESLLELIDPTEYAHVKSLSQLCLYSSDERTHCDGLWKHLRKVGWQPTLRTMKDCLIFDEEVFSGNSDVPNDPGVVEGIDRFCNDGRDGDRVPVYYGASEWTDPILWHWHSEDGRHSPTEYRLLNHFYTTIHFTDPAIDHHYKRWVRDYVRYNDEIVCTAGKVVHAMNAKANKNTSTSDVASSKLTTNKGNTLNEWSAWHVRRGDFQYKNTRLSIEDWYQNTKDFMKEGEVLYIATDEKNKTFFEPLQQHYRIFFLDDFDYLLPPKMDGSYKGMIETLVASHARTFTGTWFSTYSGYINRLRGYLGHSMKNSWYSFMERKYRMQEWEYPNGNYPAREWPIAWTGIDTDEWNEGDEDEVEGDENFDAQEGEEGFDIDSEGQEADTSSNVVISEEVVKSHRKLPSDLSLSEFHQDEEFASKPVGRGIVGRPMEHTPALKGARRAHIDDCEINVDSLAYWNNPQGSFDEFFVSPFAITGEEKYLTFALDQGGWNNVRMSMEIIFILAFVTKRTLVLPPETKLYLLHHDKGKKTRSFADFFPLYSTGFKKRVKIITMSEFIKLRKLPLPQNAKNASVIEKAAKACDKRAKSAQSCFVLNEFLEASSGFLPSFRAVDGCVVFDENKFSSLDTSPESHAAAREFCGEREITYWTSEYNEPLVIHMRANHKEYRLLTHFYSILFFTNPSVDNYVKRFVRDFLHYHDSIFCAAGKIVKALQAEADPKSIDSEGSGGYSALHVRRGDLQYKKVKIPAHLWWNNTQELFPDKNEILYIATDERNQSWFDPIAQYRPIRFLDDYWDFANLTVLDPNYMGMIDTIVASRARVFVGTWFSTFSGYINRMRGYHGLSMNHSWYSFLPRKTALHEWGTVDHYVYAYEYPTGWMGIDANVQPNKTIF
eukprot:CAMPEP_0178906600 /NCGR_PEP_ID=MMETSP0786-20121207/6914_1 /TAXON_ID=186022 /ORGANISM="Thalassionema frauenfeldii, Strain CCMP 1798" /LENGTH=1170 /DNA_ID=CAMNT_0020578323 /DNA_START=144 /DNA_END=3656 /DNA_ORIENTATION=-